MSFPVFGIAATSRPDQTGEVLDIAGADIDHLGTFNDEHGSEKRMFNVLGQVTQAKKIFKPEECEDDYQTKCWNLVKRPFIYVFGNLFDDGHPNALAAQSLLKYSVQHPDFPIGLSVEGATLEKNANQLKKTKIVRASLTVRPCNPDARLFPVNNLVKSFEGITLPEVYKNVQGRKGFRNVPTLEQRILAKSLLIKEVNALLKSAQPDTEGATIIRCWNCGEGKLFMKSRIPNRCPACAEAFSMQDIFNARTRPPIV